MNAGAVPMVLSVLVVLPASNARLTLFRGHFPGVALSWAAVNRLNWPEVTATSIFSRLVLTIPAQ